MIKSDYFKTVEECIDFLAGYPIDADDRKRLIEYAEFFADEETVFYGKVYDQGTYAYAYLVLVGHSRTEYTLHIEEGEDYGYLSYEDGRLYFKKLVWDSFGFYTNKLMGIIPLKNYDEVSMFEIDVCRWS